MPVPDGWVQIIRGPRPKAENWPRSKPSVVVQKEAQGRQPARPQPMQAKFSGMRTFQDPSVKITTARERLSKLEAALAAMTRMDGPEVESLRVAHKRAQVAVQGVPVEAQVKECEAFLTRARSHLEELDSKRATIMENIKASEKRLLEFRTKMQAVSPTEESEVQQLRGLVSQLQAQVDSLRGPSVDTHSPNPTRPCRRKDFVPFCDEEFQEWMEGRRKNLQTAVEMRQFSEVARISQLLAQAALEWQQRSKTKPCHSHQQWPILCSDLPSLWDVGSSSRGGIKPRTSIVASSPQEPECYVRDLFRRGDPWHWEKRGCKSGR